MESVESIVAAPRLGVSRNGWPFQKSDLPVSAFWISLQSVLCEHGMVLRRSTRAFMMK